MTTVPRSALLLSNHADVKQTLREVNEYLALLGKEHPHDMPIVVQGIWIDAGRVERPPAALILPCSDGKKHAVRILESLGRKGI